VGNDPVSVVDTDGRAPQPVSMTYDPVTGKWTTSYVDSKFLNPTPVRGQPIQYEEAVWLFIPNPKATFEESSAAMAQAFDPELPASLRTAAAAAGVSIAIMGVVELVPGGKLATTPLKKEACKTTKGVLFKTTKSAAKREVIVVGEGMNRVEEMARRLRVDGLNVRTYPAPNMNRAVNPNAYGSSKSLDANWHWADYWARKKQVDVIDIGLQRGRTTPSPYYQMESQNLLRWEGSGQIQPVIRIDPGF